MTFKMLNAEGQGLSLEYWQTIQMSRKMQSKCREGQEEEEEEFWEFKLEKS